MAEFLFVARIWPPSPNPTRSLFGRKPVCVRARPISAN